MKPKIQHLPWLALAILISTPIAHSAPGVREEQSYSIAFKPEVDLANLDPVMAPVIEAVVEVYADLNIPVKPLITSAAEPYAWRAEWSLHRVGRAIDLRGKTLPISTLAQIRDELQTRLGDDFDVILENYGAFNPRTHLHIEYDRR